MSEADKWIRTAEAGAAGGLGFLAIKIIIGWFVENWILIGIFLAVMWVHDTGIGKNARLAQINTFPVSAVTVTNVAYSKPREEQDYFTATVRNGGPARIYDFKLSCSMTFRASEVSDRDTFDTVKTVYYYGYIKPGETLNLRLNADGSGLVMAQSIRITGCQPEFQVEPMDMLKLQKVS